MGALIDVPDHTVKSKMLVWQHLMSSLQFVRRAQKIKQMSGESPLLRERLQLQFQ